MPFDPVRDAVLNSPTTTLQPPFPTTIPSNDSPTSASSSSSIVSPSLGRRATDLSVLLNAEPEDPPTPVRSASLSHLLLPADIHDDKLPHVPSLSRNSDPNPRQEESHSTQRPSSSHSKLTLPSSPSLSFDAGSSSRPITASSITRSPVVSNSRPSSSSSSSRPRSMSTMRQRPATAPTLPAPAPPPSTVPYNPRHRVTVADSVLRPITPDEIESYRDTYSFGTRRLKKRKRGESGEPDASDQRPTKKLAGDVGVVVEHCEYFASVSFVSNSNLLFASQITHGQMLVSGSA